MAVIRGENQGASYVASGDLSGAIYRMVTAGANGLDVYLATSGGAVAGVLHNKPRDNEHASVWDGGHVKITLAASLGANQEFSSGANGFATGVASGGNVVGRTMTAGNSGEVVEAILNVPGYMRAV